MRRQCRAKKRGASIDYVCGEASRGGVVRTVDARYVALRRELTALQKRFARTEHVERMHVSKLDAFEQARARLQREHDAMMRSLKEHQARLKAIQEARLTSPQAAQAQATAAAPMASVVAQLTEHTRRYKRALGELEVHYKATLRRMRQESRTATQLTERIAALEDERAKLLNLLRAANDDYTQMNEVLQKK